MARRSKVVNHPLLPILVTGALLALIFWLLNSKTPQQPLTNVANTNQSNMNVTVNQNTSVNQNANDNSNANTNSDENEEDENETESNTNLDTNSPLNPNDISPDDL